MAYGAAAVVAVVAFASDVACVVHANVAVASDAFAVGASPFVAAHP